MEYTTQMDAARKGICTKEMEIVARKEHMAPEQLMALMAEGKAIIPCNKKHTCIAPSGLGSMLTTKINVNLGTSRDLTDLNMELTKVQTRRGDGGGGYHGPELLWRHAQIPPDAHGKMPGDDRHCAHLRRGGLLP